jgi:chromosome segregation ATPase
MPDTARLMPRFEFTFNLGHLLIVASSIASFAYGYARLEARDERMQDALRHETERREELGQATTTALAAVQQQQTAAIEAVRRAQDANVERIESAIREVRGDVRRVEDRLNQMLAPPRSAR